MIGSNATPNDAIFPNGNFLLAVRATSSSAGSGCSSICANACSIIVFRSSRSSIKIPSLFFQFG